MKNIITLMVFALLLSGCWTNYYGSPNISNKSKIEQIKKGVTTKQEMEKWFGESGWVIKNSEKLYTYTYTEERVVFLIFAATTREIISQIQVTYDSRNRVKNYDYVIGEKTSY